MKILPSLHYSCHNLATTWVSKLPILFVNYTFRTIYCDFKFFQNSTFKSFKIPKVRISTTLNNTLKSNPPP